MTRISVAVPTYAMPNAEFFMRRLLDSLWVQNMQDFEIVVTDNSDDDVVESVCRRYVTGIRYLRNPRKGMAANTNEAIRQSSGRMVKILYMDDYMAHPDALGRMYRDFDGRWLVTGCGHAGTDGVPTHVHYPTYSPDIHTGNNTIGSPSVLTILNDDPLMFDENLGFLLDCDYYRRMFDLYGSPTISDDVGVIIGIHDDQVSNSMTGGEKLAEHRYMIDKFDKKHD